MLLEPFERSEIEVVRRLVEQEQVGSGDDEPSQGGTGLFAARQRRWRTRPLVAPEAEPRERLVDAQVDRVALERFEPVTHIGIASLRRPACPFETGKLALEALDLGRAAPNRRPEVRC